MEESFEDKFEKEFRDGVYRVLQKALKRVPEEERRNAIQAMEEMEWFEEVVDEVMAEMEIEE